MNEKEFNKTIIYDQMARTSDTTKFLLKSYLDIKLRSGARDVCRIYAAGRVSGHAGHDVERFKELEIKKLSKSLTELFNNIKKDGYWITATSKANYYIKGKEVFEKEGEFEPNDYDTKVVTTTETTYMMHKDLDIKQNKLEEKKWWEIWK